MAAVLGDDARVGGRKGRRHRRPSIFQRLADWWGHVGDLSAVETGEGAPVPNREELARLVEDTKTALLRKNAS